ELGLDRDALPDRAWARHADERALPVDPAARLSAERRFIQAPFITCIHLIRAPICLSAHASSGNFPSLSLDQSSSPLAVSSKQPPPEGMSFSSAMRCLYSVSNLAARPTALGS